MFSSPFKGVNTELVVCFEAGEVEGAAPGTEALLWMEILLLLCCSLTPPPHLLSSILSFLVLVLQPLPAVRGGLGPDQHRIRDVGADSGCGQIQ